MGINHGERLYCDNLPVAKGQTALVDVAADSDAVRLTLTLKAFYDS